MSVLPDTQDVRHAREQAEATAVVAFDSVKSPLFAALGAVDAATHTVSDAFTKLRNEAAGRKEEAQQRLHKTLNSLQSLAADLPKEVGELRHRLEPAELRKLAEEYREAAQKTYHALIERGEEVFGELRNQPRVKQALESVESGVDTAQQRLEIAVRDLNNAVDELRSRFAASSWSIGEQFAQRTERAATTTAERVQEAGAAAQEAADKAAVKARETADDAADAVTEAGGETAATTRSAARKVAERSSPPRKSGTRRPGENSTRKS